MFSLYIYYLKYFFILYLLLTVNDDDDEKMAGEELLCQSFCPELLKKNPHSYDLFC